MSSCVLCADMHSEHLKYTHVVYFSCHHTKHKTALNKEAALIKNIKNQERHLFPNLSGNK